MNSLVDDIKAEPTVPELGSPATAVLVAFFSPCNVCAERFALHEDLVQHMTCHRETHPAACRHCPALFVGPAELSEHVKQQHAPAKRRRRPAPAKVDPRLRCAVCGIDSFPSFSYFHDHHVFHHLVTRPEPRVILERPQSGAAAAAAAALKLTLRRSSQEQNGLPHQFEVIPSDGCSSTGSDSGMDSSEAAQAGPAADQPDGPPSDGPLLEEALTPPDETKPPPPPPAEEDNSRWSAGPDGAGSPAEDAGDAAEHESAEHEPPEHEPAAADGAGEPAAAQDGSCVDSDADHQEYRAPDGGGGPFDDYMSLRLSDGDEPADSGLPSDAEPAESEAGAPRAVVGVTADVLAEGEEQDDVLRLLDSLNRAGARSAATPPLPRLIPVGSPAGGQQQRMTASAPPRDVEGPAGSPAPPRSVSSDPGTSAGDGDLVPPSLQDLVPPAAEPAAEPGAEPDAEQAAGQPLIRMAAIAATIPDERSFRHEATPQQPQSQQPQTQSPQPPQLQPRPDGARPAAAQPATSLPPLTQGMPRPPAPPQQQAGAVSCFVCHIPLPDVRALQEHLATHQNSLQCSMCPFKASSIDELRAHSVTFHGKMQTGAVGRPPNSNMSAHMAAMRPLGGQPGMALAGAPRYPHIRRGRPPLDPNRMAQLHMANGLPGRGLGLPPRPGMPLPPGGRVSVISPGQKRPPPGLVGHDPSKRPRPGIPIQPDKSDCQVIAVQRRQQGVPVIQNVEGSAHAAGAGGSTIRLSDSITLSVQGSGGGSGGGAAPAPGADVASILANRGISITPASSAAAPAPAPQPPLSLPNLPAGISLTPAAGSADGFAVPRPPGVQQTSASRPARPPTVDLTADTPTPPPARGPHTCRYCERTLPSAAGLLQHEKAHLSGPNQNLRCRVCGIVMQNLALLQQHMQARHGSALPPGPQGRGGGALSELVVPVFDLNQVSRDQLEALGVRGFLPVSQVSQRQGQLGLPIISLQGLGKTGPSPRPVAFFNLGPVRPLR